MRRSLIPLTVVVLGMFAGHAALAQNGTTRRPLVGPDRPLAEKLRSPRETLQTLYYAVDVYDYFPQVIADAKLAIYGPFNVDGKFTSVSNADFDRSLRARAPHMGIRDAAAVDALARASGFDLVLDAEMPANNRCRVWQRTAG